MNVWTTKLCASTSKVQTYRNTCCIINILSSIVVGVCRPRACVANSGGNGEVPDRLGSHFLYTYFLPPPPPPPSPSSWLYTRKNATQTEQIPAGATYKETKKEETGKITNWLSFSYRRKRTQTITENSAVGVFCSKKITTRFSKKWLVLVPIVQRFCILDSNP